MAERMTPRGSHTRDTINGGGDPTGGESSGTTISQPPAREIDEDVEITQPFNGSWLGTINGPNS